jgi:hypothetical protein
MKVLGGIVLIVLAGIWLLRGILTVLVTTGPTQGGAVTGVIFAALLLTVGISVLRRGLARREPSSPPT